jgi:hypothetical protein
MRSDRETELRRRERTVLAAQSFPESVMTWFRPWAFEEATPILSITSLIKALTAESRENKHTNE